MPCNTVVRNSLTFEVARLDLLERAIKQEIKDVHVVRKGQALVFWAHGSAVTLTQGRLESKMPASQLGALSDRLKQAYSREAIREAARKTGFKLQQKAGDLNAFTLTKQAF